MTGRLSVVARYAFGEQVDDARVEVRDLVEGRTVLVCHETTARRWLAWIDGPPAGPGEWVEDNDLRVCSCLHLCASHCSTLADYSQVPGVGNGQCGMEGCRCDRFDVVIEKATATAG